MKADRDNFCKIELLSLIVPLVKKIIYEKTMSEI